MFRISYIEGTHSCVINGLRLLGHLFADDLSVMGYKRKLDC